MWHIGFCLALKRPSMKLHGKRLLMIVADGVSADDAESIRLGFEKESAEVYLVTTKPVLTVTAESTNKQDTNLVVDLPLEAIDPLQYDGLILPDGLLAAENLREDPRIIGLVHSFYERAVPLFASGEAVRILEESGVLLPTILVRDRESVASFIDRAIDCLIEDRPIVHKQKMR